MYPVNLIVDMFKLIPNWLPLLSLASMFDVILIWDNTSTPLPIDENLNLNGTVAPVIGVFKSLSIAPNLILPVVGFTNVNHVLGSSDLISSNLILVASYTTSNCSADVLFVFESTLNGISMLSVVTVTLFKLSSIFDI